MAEPQFQYHFSNVFNPDISTNGGPTFLRHHGINGHLRILRALENNIDKVKLVLKGVLTNVVCHRCDPMYRKCDFGFQRTVLQLEDVQQSVSSWYNPDDGNGECFPFNFRLPRFDQDTKQAHTIPSSLVTSGNFCAFSLPQDPCRAETRVKYFLEATIYSEDSKIATSVKDIRIIDSPDAHPPPVHLAHFAYEYICSMETTLRRMRFYGTHKLGISVAEPKPVEVGGNGGVIFAAFPVRFVIPLDSKNPRTIPKPLSIRIKSQLLSFTFMSVTPMMGQPTIGEAKLLPFLAVIQKTCRSYNRKMVVEWGSGDTNPPEPRKGTWEHSTVVWLPICETSMPTPTFLTSHLARRYSVALRFDIQSNGKGTFLLTVPLQIVYPTGQDQDEVDCMDVQRLPTYVH